MSKTFKIQRAYRAFKKTFEEFTFGMQRRHAIDDAMRDVGQRYGNQRRMRAKLKLSERRIRRRKENRFDRDTE